MEVGNHYCKEVDVQLGWRISTDRQVAPKEALDIMGTGFLKVVPATWTATVL